VRKVLAIVAVVLAVVIAVPLLYVDSIAKGALESGASETFGTKTTLGSVRLGLITGRVGVRNLRVSNPEGWQAKHFFTIGGGRFGVNIQQFLEDEVEVPELVLEDVYVSLEKSAGGSNYDTILSHMQKGPPPPPDANPKRFVIRDVRIRDVEADLRFDAPGPVDKELKVLIPEIRLRNLGSNTEGGMLVSQVWGTVMRAVLAAVVREGGGVAGFITRDLAGGLAGLGGGVPIEVVGDVTKIGSDLAEGAGRTVGEKIDQATGGALGEAGELGSAAGDAVKKGLGGLLDRKD